jgi:phage tail-like protein
VQRDGNSDLAPRIAQSRYLDYLPLPYHAALDAAYDDESFLVRFLQIFESVLAPLEQTVDMLPQYFDARVAPPAMVPWLASWVALELDERWPEDRRRRLIMQAATLYRWRGTRRGLREHLRLYSGHAPLIVENFQGPRPGPDVAVEASIGPGQQRRHWLTITVVADAQRELDERILRQIIEFQKPAHVAYTLAVGHPTD